MLLRLLRVKVIQNTELYSKTVCYALRVIRVIKHSLLKIHIILVELYPCVPVKYYSDYTYESNTRIAIQLLTFYTLNNMARLNSQQ